MQAQIEEPNEQPSDVQIPEFDAGPEVFIGLVGAIGTKLDVATQAIKDELRYYSFQGVEIPLSRMFDQFPDYKTLHEPKRSKRDYYVSAIEAGNKICALFKDAGAIAQLGIAEVVKHRVDENEKGKKVGYIFKSFKRAEEIRRARQVYGSLFYCIAVYADTKDLSERLARQFRPRTEDEKKEETSVFVRRLMERDRCEEGDDYGQNVRDAFTCLQSIGQMVRKPACRGAPGT